MGRPKKYESGVRIITLTMPVEIVEKMTVDKGKQSWTDFFIGIYLEVKGEEIIRKSVKKVKWKNVKQEI